MFHDVKMVERLSCRFGRQLLPSSLLWRRQCLRILGYSWWGGEKDGLDQLERGPGATHRRECLSVNNLRDAEDKKVKSQALDHKTKESRSIIDSRELGEFLAQM